MNVTITFSSETVKELTHRLRLAWHQGKLLLVKQLSALLLLADRLPVYTIACRLGVSTTTIYDWRDAFLMRRWASLQRGKSTDGPPNSPPTNVSGSRNWLSLGQKRPAMRRAAGMQR